MPNDMSFLPEDYLQRRIARRTNVICLTLFVVVMGGVIAAWFVTDRQRTEIKVLQNKVNGQFEEAARRLEQLEQLQEQKKQMINKANVTSALVERVPRSLLLAELINHMPASLSLLEMDLDTKVLREKRPPRTSMQKAKKQAGEKAAKRKKEVRVPKTELNVSLIGVAPTDVEVAQFMTALGGHQMFEEVHLQYSEQTKIDDRVMRKFRVHMKINQDINPQDLEPTMVRRGLNNNPMSDTIQIDDSGQLVVPEPNVTPVVDVDNDGKGQ